MRLQVLEARQDVRLKPLLLIAMSQTCHSGGKRTAFYKRKDGDRWVRYYLVRDDTRDVSQRNQPIDISPPGPPAGYDLTCLAAADRSLIDQSSVYYVVFLGRRWDCNLKVVYQHLVDLADALFPCNCGSRPLPLFASLPHCPIRRGAEGKPQGLGCTQLPRHTISASVTSCICKANCSLNCGTLATAATIRREQSFRRTNASRMIVRNRRCSAISSAVQNPT